MATYKKAKLPEGIFALVNPALDPADPRDLEPETEMIGPYDGSRVVYEHDNATVLLSEGLPMRLGVVKQRGNILTLEGGAEVRIVRWPQ